MKTRNLILATLLLFIACHVYGQSTHDTIPNNSSLIFHDDNAIDDGTEIYRGTGGALRFHYNGAVAIFKALSNDALRFQDMNGTTMVQLHPAGNSYFKGGSLGIGNSASVGLFDVYGKVYFEKPSNNALILNRTTTTGKILEMQADGVATGTLVINANDFILRGDTGKGLRLQTNGSNSALTIDTEQNVGIGTANPSEQLHVEGDGKFVGSSETGMNSAHVSISNTGSGGAYYSRLYLRAEYYNQILFQNQSGTQDPNQNTFASISGNTGVRSLSFSTSTADSPTSRMTIISSGEVGIGTTTPTNKLEVNGTIRSKEVKVEATGWPDYVFSENYELTPLSEIKTYVAKNHHLPDVPSADQVAADGINLGEMNALLLKKIEELMLHLIEMKEENKEMKKDIEKLKSKIQ